MAEVDHRALAVSLFNQTGDLLDKSRTEEEDYLLVLMAHASCYHWSKVGTTLEQARGEWQISRVHAVLGQGQIALWHAEQSLKLCLENGFGDIDLAFGYEAVARAYSILGKADEMQSAIDSAIAAAKLIESVEDQTYTLKEIGTIQNLH